ncbi:MAG TPA: ABC transporter ATP-binding protein [Candidatus Acidoferrales bacterium]|nr:ABC transporter ATP-binding protein [Candidatus Acidoferrales bacterium]
MTTPAIEFREVTKVYRRRLRGVEIAALTNVSFEVAPAEVCAFLGPNGAGKTTSISLLMGFHYADLGEIRVLGYAPGDVRAKKGIGFLPENFAFYKYMTAPKLLRFHAKLAGLSAGDAEMLIPKLLTQVKLNGYEELKIGKYSRGMVQRLGIAQAMLCDPQLVVLDEPTSGLDPAGRKDVRDTILEMKAEGKTIFLSSHILSEVEQICDRVIIIDRGRLVRQGTLQEMLGPGDTVEIVTDMLPQQLEPVFHEMGAKIEATARGIQITAPMSRKREAAELLWNAGCDVRSMNPVRGSLEQLFLELVGGDGKAA